MIVVVCAVAVAAALVYLGLARLLRTQGAAPAALQALRDERDRLAAELERERASASALGAEVARLNERSAGIPRLEQERDEARSASQAATDATHRAQAALSARESELAAVSVRLREAEQQLAQLRLQLDALGREHAEASAHLRHSEQANQQLREFIEDAKKNLSGAFAELAGKTFDERAQRASQDSKGQLETLLKPFSEQLHQFQEKVGSLYRDEAKERNELVGAVNALKTLNENMASSADALTRALKGSAKVRGDWGELMLESVLRSSGLEEGAHFERQRTSTDDDGRRLRPDVVIRLPGDRRIVVDSKVNLVAWEEAMNAETPEAQQDAMRRHAVALRQHVKDLADRNYPRAVGESALDVTVAFVPIEGALSAALGFDGALQSEAFGKGVVFASPNTLMAVLRVVDRLWTREKLQKQAAEISRTGGLLLDSVINFLADFASVGTGLDDAAKAYRAARDRLEESSHAVIPRARRLAELGVKGKKKIPAELLPEELDADAETGASPGLLADES